MDRLQKAKKTKRVSRGRDGATEWSAEVAKRDPGGRAGQQETGLEGATPGCWALSALQRDRLQLNAQSGQGQVRERGKGPKGTRLNKA